MSVFASRERESSRAPDDPGSAYGREFGVRVTERGPGRSAIEAEIDERHTNATGFAHGGAVAALMDIVLTIAAGQAGTYEDRRFSITLSLTTNFLAPVPKGPVRAIARTVGGGAKTVFCEAELLGERSTLLATANGVFRLVPHPEGDC